ncbi:WxL domain-containing protein [Carnobacterium gallinarum]|uniref:WxL domain-containing protein n=1 Tax=Carnobacterium gallinarum TaxID=2749 RepID=UPI000554FB34|nr:WxL domain-containing protein [Carnobacterium gallinarum]
MKLTKLVLVGALTFSSLLAAPLALAADGTADTSQGDLTFKKKTTITEPTDPEVDPDTDPDVDPPYIPDVEKPGIPGDLTVVYATDLKFPTVEISGNDATYYANLAKGSIKNPATGAITPVVRPNYVEINDGRGTNTGWELTATQNGQFKTDSGKILTNAALSFADLGFNSKNLVTDGSTTPTAFAQKITLDPSGAEASTIATAVAGQGMGSWHTLFGQRDFADPSSVANGTADKAVSLFVPGITGKVTETYKTSVTWTLIASPK